MASRYSQRFQLTQVIVRKLVRRGVLLPTGPVRDHAFQWVLERLGRVEGELPSADRCVARIIRKRVVQAERRDREEAAFEAAQYAPEGECALPTQSGLF